MFGPARIVRLTSSAEQRRATVLNFGSNDGPGDFQAGGRVIGAPVLFAAQQDVSGDRPLHAGDEATVFREERQRDAAFGAECQQAGADTDPSEADNCFQMVQWDGQSDLALDPHADGFAFAAQVRALRLHEQRVGMCGHGWNSSET